MSKSKLSKEYSEATKWLFQQFPSYQIKGQNAFKPTLKNSEEISKFLNHPKKSLKLIHIAGSNGKGSTSSMLASILTENGYNVGLFTSPHLKDYRERIRINGIKIPKSDIIFLIKKIKDANFNFTPSFFEITFNLAINYFKNNSCDICIIETGLGGKLDATNIINPILSIITNISLEHTDILGDTIELIAKEKAGIIKAKTPVILGEMKVNAKKTIKSVAHKFKSEVIESNKFKSKVNLFNLPLLGEYQLENFATVLASLSELKKLNFKLENNLIQQGLKNISQNTGFTARMQIISKKPQLIYDVSHNLDGILTSLKTILNINTGELHIIFGASKDKSIASSLDIFPLKSRMYFTEFNNERSSKIDILKKLSKTLKFSSKEYFTDSKEALEVAKKNASSNDTILIIGSFFLISDFL